MPGIAGIISKNSSKNVKSELVQMLDLMKHETFYASGTHVNEQLGIFAGWVCHEGSFSEHMPVWNEARNVCMIFSGEDFRDPREIEQLRHGGHECGSDNASYLVHLYEEMGLEFIGKLNGWFSGVLVDLRTQRVVLFNDRYGMGRIYYHENKDGFYFASEAKSLLKVLPGLRHVDSRGLSEAISFGCVLQDRTLFSGISLLPTGSMWVFAKTGGLIKDRYFKPEIWEQQPLLDRTEFYEKLKEIFPRILPRYFRGKRRVAMSLTGGLDGRMIMAWKDCTPGELPCYTFGGSYRDCTDVRIARKVARRCQQTHETITVGSPFLDEFPRMAEKAVYVSDGTMDVTGSVELYVNNIAREIAPVRMTGNYGSEILRGNVAFKPGSVCEELWDPGFARLVRTASETYRRERQDHKLSFIGFKQIPWHHYSRLAVEQSQLTLRSPYLDNDLVSLMYQAPPELVTSNELSLRLIAEGNPDLAAIPTDRGLSFRPLPVLGKMQHFLSEFTFKTEYTYDYGMPQWLAGIDHMLTPLHLERMFLGRHKFYHFRVWYRDRLSQYVRDVLLDPCTRERPYFRPGFLEEMVNAHIRGHRNYTSEIHQALTVELLQRTLVDL